MDADDLQIPYRYEIVFDAGLRARIARGLVLQSFRRPVIWAVLTSMALLGLAVLAAGGGPWFLAAPLVLLVLLALNYIGLLVRIGRSAPDGAVQRSGFTDEGLRVGLEGASSTFSLDRIASIRRRDDLVWVTLKPVKRELVWPTEIFPDEEITRIRTAIAVRTAEVR